MKRILLVLSVSMLVLGAMCQDAFANGGVAAVVVRRPILFPRVAIRRAAIVAPQAVVVAPQAVIAAPFIRQRFVSPLIVHPQAYFAPQAIYSTQAFIAPQRFVVPQVQAFSTGCSSAAFFSY